MISFTEQQTLYGDLTQNTTASNLARGAKLANIEHRYLLQKYFNNEGSYSISTVGGSSATLTSAPAVNAVSATLSVAWAFPTTSTTITFSDGETRIGSFINASTAVTWSVGLTGTKFNTTAVIASAATSATLETAWATATQSSTTVFSDGSTKTVTFTLNSTAITWVGGLSQAVSAYVYTSVMTAVVSIGAQQFYRLPPNYSKLKSVTITVGNLKWTPTEVLTREEWDKLNVFPYYSDIPNNFFIYPGGDHGGQIGIWPIPSTTGNTITFNYKYRLPDLSIADVTNTASLAVTQNSSTVTDSGASWTTTKNSQLESRWIKINDPKGDGLWYQIASIDSTSSLTLFQPYQGVTVSTGTGVTGQMPLLMEDFQDMLVWKPIIFYFSSIVPDPIKVKEFAEMYAQKLKQLDEYAGSKTINVNLGRRPMNRNPNLYGQTFG